MFVIELFLAALPESAAEETALVLGKRSSHQGSSCCIQVGLNAQRKAAEDHAGGDRRPRRSHTGPLWVTICKSLGLSPSSERLCIKLRASRALYTDPHLPVAAAIPPGRAFTGGGVVGSCLLLIGSERLVGGGTSPLRRGKPTGDSRAERGELRTNLQEKSAPRPHAVLHGECATPPTPRHGASSHP